MIDLLKILSAAVLGYLLFLGTIILLAKLLFPFAEKNQPKGRIEFNK